MLYILAIAAGIGMGVLAGGSASALLDLKLKKFWLILLAFALQTLAQVAGGKGLVESELLIMLFYGVSYFLLFMGFWFNRRYLGIITMGAGCFLNALVIMLNNGRMPVSMEALEKANLKEAIKLLESGSDVKHSVMNEGTRLGFLADITYIPYFPGFLMRVVSVGDLVVTAGLFIFMYEIVRGKNGGCYNERVN